MNSHPYISTIFDFPKWNSVYEQDMFAGDRITTKIKSLKSLKSGWDFGQGEEISNETIEYALEVYRTLCSISSMKFKTNAAPTSNGGIILTFGLNDDFIDVIINPDFTMNLVQEKGVGVDYEIKNEIENVPFVDVLTQLSSLCNSFVQFITPNSIQQNGDSTAIYSKTIKDQFLYSRKNAQKQRAPIYQTT